MSINRDDYEELSVLDEFVLLYNEAANKAAERFDYVKEYISENIENYVKTGMIYHVVDSVIDLPEVKELMNFVEQNDELRFEIRKAFNGEISEDQPHITAIESGLNELEIVKELKNKLENTCSNSR